MKILLLLLLFHSLRRYILFSPLLQLSRLIFPPRPYPLRAPPLPPHPSLFCHISPSALLFHPRPSALHCPPFPLSVSPRPLTPLSPSLPPLPLYLGFIYLCDLNLRSLPLHGTSRWPAKAAPLSSSPPGHPNFLQNICTFLHVFFFLSSNHLQGFRDLNAAGISPNILIFLFLLFISSSCAFHC